MQGLLRASLLLLPFVLACAVNPVTGRREIVLMSESQEIALGKQSAPQIAASMGLYEDEALVAYVEEIGLRMAAISERPELPWQFRIVDDPLVNAFAVPGGFIYVTRGILAHFGSEAQLASVLGHEIGHVTARHSVAQYTKQMGAQLVLLPTLILVPELAPAGQLLGAGLQVMLLQYSRGDESQSDELGFGYMTRVGYDAREMPRVFRTLDRIGQEAGADGMPEWLSTHPKPANRETAMKTRLAALPEGALGKRVGRADYLARIDGLVYGTDPRQGWFDGDGVFHHPDLAFRLRFPEDWTHVNQRAVVGGISPDQDATAQLALAPEPSAQEAARAFLSGDGMQSSTPRSETIGGLAAVTADFAAVTQGGTIRGVAAFVEHGDHVYRVLGYAPQERFGIWADTLRGVLRSFARETRAEVLNVEPWRIDVVTPAREYSIEGFARAYPGPVPAEELALMNQIEPGGRYAAGVPAKRVVGEALP